jgi:probable HAF family extracellular repeat protein
LLVSKRRADLLERSQFALSRSVIRIVDVDSSVLTEQGKETYEQTKSSSRNTQEIRFGAVLGLSLTSNSLLGQTSTITKIQTLGGTAITGMALNNAGQVIGYSTIAGNAEQHAFSYNAGVTFDIGTLGGTFSQANAINHSGQIAGLSLTSVFKCALFFTAMVP